MAKLYLVRRNLEVFTGPMTLVEMKDAYKRMQFGLQDEVAGHCGPWVAFENLERIKKQYPEVARIVHEDMVAGWNISSDNEGKLINEDTKRLAIRSVRGMSLALVFLLIAIVAFVAALYMANAAKTAGKAKEQFDSALRPAELQDYLGRGDVQGFDQTLQRHAKEVVAEVKKRPLEASSWMPYLRHYAFAHDGQMAGLDPKLLRGDEPSAAPVDCSLRMWRRRWRSSSKDWNDLLTEQRLVRAHWARLLAWDPYWIKRREASGWIGERNYYTACLTMAERALNDVAQDLAKGQTAAQWEQLGYSRIKARLQWLQAAANQESLQAPKATLAAAGDGGSIGIWTCFEAAQDVGALHQCRQQLGTPPQISPVWLAYNEERYGWNLLRLAASTHGPLAPELVTMMTEQGDKMNSEDHYTRFDYQPEAQLFKTLLQAGTPAEKAVEKTQTAFPHVKLSH